MPVDMPVPSTQTMSSDGSIRSRVPLVRSRIIPEHDTIVEPQPVYVTDGQGRIIQASVLPPSYTSYPQVPYPPPPGFQYGSRAYEPYSQQVPEYIPQSAPYNQPVVYNPNIAYNPTFTEPQILDNLKLQDLGKSAPLVGPSDNKSLDPVRRVREDVHD